MKYDFKSLSNKDDKLLKNEQNSKKIVGVALDSYDDNLSRKAVGKLFYNDFKNKGMNDTEDNIYSSIAQSNKGFDKDEKEELYNIFSNSKEKEQSLLKSYIDSLRDYNTTEIKTLRETIECLDKEKEIKKQNFLRISLKNITILTSVIFLFILILLVQKVLTLNAQLNNYAQSQEAFKQQINELQLMNNDLETLIDEMNNDEMNGEEINSDSIQENIIDIDLDNATDNVVEENVNNSELTSYTVQKGDNLWDLSDRFYGNRSSVNIIMENNNLQTDFLNEGQILNLPNLGGVYGN